MIRLNKSIFIFLFLLTTISWGQKNIYDLENSKKFANYLYKSGDYHLAAQEYERIIFLDSTDYKAKLRLIRSYRQLKKYNLGIDKYTKWEIQNQDFDEEYIELLLLSNYFKRADLFLLHNDNFFPERKCFYQVATSMLAYDIEKADSLLQDSLQSNALNEYRTIIADVHNFNKKRMGVAIPMSIVVPGLGKVYAGYWKDGLVSFLMTGVTAWQTYRAFNQRGIRSTYGWIYAGLSTGFYIGNIYGTAKAVKKFNNTFKHKTIHRIEKATFTNF